MLVVLDFLQMFFSLVFDMSARFRRSYQAFILPKKKKL